MKRRRWLAAVFFTFALGGCGPWTAGQGQAQYAPYSHDGAADMRGGPDGGGGGGSGM
jgi:hypothetical protein